MLAAMLNMTLILSLAGFAARPADILAASSAPAITLVKALKKRPAKTHLVEVHGQFIHGSSAGGISDRNSSYQVGNFTKNAGILYKNCPSLDGQTVDCNVIFRADDEDKIVEVITASRPEIEETPPPQIYGKVFDAFLCKKPKMVDVDPKPGCFHVEEAEIVSTNYGEDVSEIIFEGKRYFALTQRLVAFCKGERVSFNSILVNSLPPGLTINDCTKQANTDSSPNEDDEPHNFVVDLVKLNGVYEVPVTINDTITLDFVIDSGASDVSIPADVVSTLVRAGKISSGEFGDAHTYVLADGTKVPSQTVTLRTLKIGDITLTKVQAAVTDAKGTLLLGQSFLSRFKSWSIDNGGHRLVLKQ
jgi:clan AA aspartic protease (TIGR02281 family)